MSPIVFLISHLGSESNQLFDILNNNPRIDIKNHNGIYKSPLDLELLINLGHKLDNTAAIYGDHLLFNTNLSSNCFFKFCKFIYFLGDPKSTLNQLLSLGYNVETALRCYQFRLRRICEMIRKNKGVLSTYLDLNLASVDEYLQLKQNLVGEFVKIETESKFPQNRLKEAEEFFEQNCYLLNRIYEKTG